MKTFTFNASFDLIQNYSGEIWVEAETYDEAVEKLREMTKWELFGIGAGSYEEDDDCEMYSYRIDY